MGHGRGRRGAVPMLFTRLKPDDIPRMNFPFLNSFLNFYIYSLSGVSASIPNYRPVIRSNSSGYRASCTVIFDSAFSISRRSSGVSSTLTAPIFSSESDTFASPALRDGDPFQLDLCGDCLHSLKRVARVQSPWLLAPRFLRPRYQARAGHPA